MSRDEIIAMRKSKAYLDYTKPYADTLAFAKLIRAAAYVRIAIDTARATP